MPKTPDETPPFVTSAARRNLLIAIGLGVASRLIPAAAAPIAKLTPKGQVVIGFSNEPTVFNPLFKGLSVDHGVWWNLFNPLWQYDENGHPVPALAREIPTVENGGLSADGLTWKIRLRDGVKWHDGQPFTAEDVKFTIELLQRQDFRASSRMGHSLVTDIKVTGPLEVTWKLKLPFAPYLSLLSSTFIVPKHIVSKVADPNTSMLNTAPIGTGPFRWSERVAGDHLTLVANHDYFGSGPLLERLVFKYVPDLTALFTQFSSGSIDYLGLQGISPDQYTQAKAIANVEIHVSPLPAVQNVTFNLGNPVLADKAVRQALYYAMDKRSIIDVLYHGLPKETESYLPDGNWAYRGDLPRHVYSPDKAKQILDEAGWKPGPDGIRVKNGRRLEFTNSTVAGNPAQEQTQLLLAQSWQAIGVSMKIHNMPGAVIWGPFWSQSQFDSLVTYTNCMIASDPNVIDRFDSHSIPAQGGSGTNVYQFRNATVDQLLEDAVRTVSLDQRKKDYARVQGIMRDELAMLPMFQVVLIEGNHKGLAGFKNNVNVLSNAWNAAAWYWKA